MRFLEYLIGPSYDYYYTWLIDFLSCHWVSEVWIDKYKLWLWAVPDLGGTPLLQQSARLEWRELCNISQQQIKTCSSPAKTSTLPTCMQHHWEVNPKSVPNCRLHEVSLRWDISPDVCWDAGGVGLVPRPAGDNPDPSVRLSHGLQQGKEWYIKQKNGSFILATFTSSF